VREAYWRALSNPASVHAICEEYRAAATLDRQQDAADRQAGRRIQCPLLVLWSSDGPLGTWYADVGGPIGLWRDWADDIRGFPMQAGHFFPEELPEATAVALSSFFMPAIGATPRAFYIAPQTSAK
jgi:haloacetate dehalogenase